MSFLKYIWISKISVKPFTTPFNPVFFMLTIVKSFEVLPKHNGYGFIFESFALN